MAPGQMWAALVAAHLVNGDVDQARSAAATVEEVVGAGMLEDLAAAPFLGLGPVFAVSNSPSLLASFERVAREPAYARVPAGRSEFLIGFATRAAVNDDWERAAVLLAAARAVVPPGAPWRSPGGYALYRHFVAEARTRLGPERARELRDRGRVMPYDEALELALSE